MSSSPFHYGGTPTGSAVASAAAPVLEEGSIVKLSVDLDGNLRTSGGGGGGGGTSSAFGDPFPADGTAAGFKDPDGNMAAAAVDVGGNVLTAASIADGADVTEGAIADAAVSTDAPGTVNAHLRGLVKLLAAGIVANPTEKTILTVCGSVSANTQIVAAVTSKRIKCVALSLRTSYSAGAIVPLLTDGNGGTTIYQDLEQAISGAVSGSVETIGGPYWICGTSAGAALYLNPNGQTVYYSISYFTDDAT